MTTEVDVVTGAFGYTGRHIAARLLNQGRRVRTLTGHPDRQNPLAGDVEVRPYCFDDPVALTNTLRGAATLYNTYWVRFSHSHVRIDDAVENSRALFAAAKRAGVSRIVHVSITNPSLTSRLPYFRGKALVEQALARCGPAYSIVRPTVIFGPGDVIINNIAWLLRRSPVFPIAGSGRYRVRPVHVDDVARLCVEHSSVEDDAVIDAVGPETFTFTELVTTIRDALGVVTPLIQVPPVAVGLLSRAVGALIGDVLLTDQELDGMMQELVYADGPASGDIRFSDWVREHGSALGRDYQSELERHFS